ncbi:hypothetical protein BKA70DRAFT_1525269 [Coprinopsis sp. MPI-PUGE-AT-0042]|nr:hypothetical protein BKA70DRAFT_1525269 [Coprinopsis sp. MPI-PUGE-AT-0042]
MTSVNPFVNAELAEHNTANMSAVIPAILAEIDTEIALRGCLEETLKARLEWASTLKATLEKGQSRDTVLGGTSQAFQKLSADALVAAELPSSILLAGPPRPNLEPSTSTLASTSLQTASSVPFRRAPPRPKPLGTRKGTFLFVNAQNVTSQLASYLEPTRYLLLRCPNCQKAAFSSLQGLLNHARITHDIEYGTHDACIKACAVEDSSMDLDHGVEVGLGPSGVLPGLQTLFERAVGVGGAPFLSPVSALSEGREHSETQLEVGVINRPEDEVHAPTALTQSLGIHGDTVALAPFLGKEAQRRKIKAYDEDVDVDSAMVEKAIKKGTKTWKMSFAQRNVAGPPDDLPALTTLPSSGELHVQGGPNVQESAVAKGPALLDHLLSSSGSRFHFSVRVAIGDRSLFMPTEERINPDHTHKWMITAESPSYAIPLSSVLKAEKPPYYVIGTARQPFLAQVELQFNEVSALIAGGQGNEEQKLILEHWVDLDPLKTGAVTLGEEQLVDAELDRTTEVKQAITGYAPFSSRKLWEAARQSQLGKATVGGTSKDEELLETPSPAYALLLEVAKRYPLTAQGRERQFAYSVPYKLASTHTQFDHLILGRQQAIKWRRARAIREELTATLGKAGFEAPAAISTAEIFLWLQETGSTTTSSSGASDTRALRSTTKQTNRETRSRSSDIDEWCGFCGLGLSLHQPSDTMVKQQEELGGDEGIRNDAEPQSTEGCSLYQTGILPGLTSSNPSMPRHETFAALVASPDRPFFHPPPRQSISRAIVQSANPSMTLFVRTVIEGLGLPTFRSALSNSFSVDQHANTREMIESSLAPHALIALVAEKLAREIIHQGSLYALKERAAALQQPFGARKGGSVMEQPRSVLTPHHILAGNQLLTPKSNRSFADECCCSTPRNGYNLVVVMM